MKDLESATMPVLSSALPATDSSNECSNSINQHRAASLWLHLGNPHKAKAKLRKPFLATQSGRVDKTTGLRTEMSVSSPRSEASHSSCISVDMDAQSERADQSRDSASSPARLEASDEMFDFSAMLLLKPSNDSIPPETGRLLSHGRVADSAARILCQLVTKLKPSLFGNVKVEYSREANWAGKKLLDATIEYGRHERGFSTTKNVILIIEAKEPLEAKGSDGFLDFSVTGTIAVNADTQIRERASEMKKNGHRNMIFISFIGPFYRPYHYIAGDDSDGLRGTIRPHNRDHLESHGSYDSGIRLDDWVDIRRPAGRKKLIKVAEDAIRLYYGHQLLNPELYGSPGKGPSQPTIWSPHSSTATIVTTLSQETPPSKRKDRDYHPDI
jgi:hypothetical protein